MKRTNGPLIILLFLVIGLGIFWIFRHEPIDPVVPSEIIEAAATPQPAPAPTMDSATPEPDAPSNSPTPAPTATPQPTETPSPTPTATPEPTAIPTVVPTDSPSPSPSASPTPESDAPTVPPTYETSGSMRSDTGTALNIIARWNLVEGGSTGHQIVVNIYAESATLHAGGLWSDLSLTVNGFTVTGGSQTVNTDQNYLHETLLGTLTMDISSGTANVTAAWSFNGTYSGKALDVISASTYVFVP